MPDITREPADVQIPDSSPVAFAAYQTGRVTRPMVAHALAQGRMRLAYQPILPATQPKDTGFHEGLIRILDSNGYIIAARDFMPLVEAHEVGREIDCAALKMGLDALARHPNLRLAVNMSARSIGYPKWMRILQNALQEGTHTTRRLVLEVSEDSAMLLPDVLIPFMREWQRHGIAFAMDDFGSGQMAIRHFSDFSFDIVKIDGQFIRGVAHNPDQQVITSALVAVAKQFDMLCVAENVENEAEAIFLRGLGVDLLQGNHFAAATVSPPWLLKSKVRQRA